VIFLKKAVGLGYNKNEDNAPKVIAKGVGTVAERIIEKAIEHGVYIKEDKSLVEILEKFDMYQEIPEELYEIIAEIFTYVYNTEKKV
jgi:flagellar biosynthesis protein